jgi:solute carrier family 6 (neurotransmitter transporter, taurine) member 6
VPYFLILVICGIPMLYMELAVGQYTRRGPIGAIGKLCPLLKGLQNSQIQLHKFEIVCHSALLKFQCLCSLRKLISLAFKLVIPGAGVASVVVSFLMSTYYNVVIAWALYYFFTAFKWDQPWMECGHRWNSDSCWLPSPHANTSKSNDSHTPTQEFFE